jgi:hypothetical protein
MMEPMSPHPRSSNLVEVTLRPSALARAGVQMMLLVVAVMVIVKSAGASSGGAALGVVAAAALGLALALPFAFDLWAYVRADADGLKVRNRLRSQRLPWPEVAGFERGVRSLVARRTDGGTLELRAVGLRYFGSKKLARERLRMLERVRATNTQPRISAPGTPRRGVGR